MVKSGRLPGTFILEGSPGITETFADILALAAVCSDADHKKESGQACGVCGACRKARQKTHPDIMISQPESDGARSFHIEKVRGITDSLYLSPNESGRKVYIIKDMQNMTQQGQNALLKSIEEPPPFAMFIITASSLDLVLETVRSRAVKFRLGDGTDPLAHMPAGYAYHDEIIKGILAKNTDKFTIYQNMLKNLEKAGILNFYHDLQTALRDILIAKIFAEGGSGARFLYFNDSETAADYADNYSVKKIFELCGAIGKFKSDLEYNANTRLNIASFLSAII